jgi:hypothetical protein
MERTSSSDRNKVAMAYADTAAAASAAAESFSHALSSVEVRTALDRLAARLEQLEAEAEKGGGASPAVPPAAEEDASLIIERQHGEVRDAVDRSETAAGEAAHAAARAADSAAQAAESAAGAGLVNNYIESVRRQLEHRVGEIESICRAEVKVRSSQVESLRRGLQHADNSGGGALEMRAAHAMLLSRVEVSERARTRPARAHSLLSAEAPHASRRRRRVHRARQVLESRALAPADPVLPPTSFGASQSSLDALELSTAAAAIAAHQSTLALLDGHVLQLSSRIDQETIEWRSASFALNASVAAARSEVSALAATSAAKAKSGLLGPGEVAALSALIEGKQGQLLAEFFDDERFKTSLNLRIEAILAEAERPGQPHAAAAVDMVGAMGARLLALEGAVEAIARRTEAGPAMDGLAPAPLHSSPRAAAAAAAAAAATAAAAAAAAPVAADAISSDGGLADGLRAIGEVAEAARLNASAAVDECKRMAAQFEAGSLAVLSLRRASEPEQQERELLLLTLRADMNEWARSRDEAVASERAATLEMIALQLANMESGLRLGLDAKTSALLSSIKVRTPCLLAAWMRSGPPTSPIVLTTANLQPPPPYPAHLCPIARHLYQQKQRRGWPPITVPCASWTPALPNRPKSS